MSRQNQPSSLHNFDWFYDSLEPNKYSPGRIATAFHIFNLDESSDPVLRSVRLDLAKLWLDKRLNLRAQS